LVCSFVIALRGHRGGSNGSPRRNCRDSSKDSVEEVAKRILLCSKWEHYFIDLLSSDLFGQNSKIYFEIF
jgi:hypothetical protein